MPRSVVDIIRLYINIYIYFFIYKAFIKRKLYPPLLVQRGTQHSVLTIFSIKERFINHSDVLPV